MLKGIDKGGGCFLLGCFGGFGGMTAGAALVGVVMHGMDPDTQAFGALFYGGIPGVLLGLLIWLTIRGAMKRK